MKKHYVALPFVFAWGALCLIALLGFIWEVVEVGRFVLFAFITSVGIPLTLEIILILYFCQYIVIDEIGVRKYLFNKKIKGYQWGEIKEIKQETAFIYISLEQLKGERKQWNRKKLIFIMYTDKAKDSLKEHMKEGIITNL